jgi:fumarate reductase subunit C
MENGLLVMKPVTRTSREVYIRKVSSLYWRNQNAEETGLQEDVTYVIQLQNLHILGLFHAVSQAKNNIKVLRKYIYGFQIPKIIILFRLCLCLCLVYAPRYENIIVIVGDSPVIRA